MRPTSNLIDSLVADAAPVRRLRPPMVRAAGWLLLAVLILVLAASHHGVRPDLATKLAQPVFVTGVAAALLTGVLAAVAAFMASVPGRSRRWLLLPAPALVAWFATVGYGCLTNWVQIGPTGISLGETASCFATLMMVGVPLSFALLIMLRHVARIYPAPVAMCASLAVAAMTATALSILHPLDATAMILMWNFGVALLFVGLGGRYGDRLFHWVAPR
ncbi:NrsF family protein [Cupriavidus sp. NPDC089707]|uniref:NrsF family protein n=1 Tax=Cupriavidus sp. NPDC089707 TaxID=3363963 RepID=UPI0037F1E658